MVAAEATTLLQAAGTTLSLLPHVCCVCLCVCACSVCVSVVVLWWNQLGPLAVAMADLRVWFRLFLRTVSLLTQSDVPNPPQSLSVELPLF